MPLTGRFWFRKTWTGKVVVMAEEQSPRWLGRKGAFKQQWRDATLTDFAKSVLKPLLALEHTHRAAALEATFAASRALCGEVRRQASGGPGSQTVYRAAPWAQIHLEGGPARA